MSQYKVLKPFTGEREYKAGEVVSLEGRNLDKLVDLRFLAPLEPKPVPKVAAEVASVPAPKKRGRPKGSKNKSKAQAEETPSVQ
jgi:hypothetical protein